MTVSTKTRLQQLLRWLREPVDEQTDEGDEPRTNTYRRHHAGR